jgi:hypothetical protein
MRGDQRLERGERVARRRCSERFRTGAALALVLAFAAARTGAADRPELRYPDIAPALPEREGGLERPAPIAAPDRGLTLLWFDPKDLFLDGFEPIAREVTGIFREIGVGIRWERGESGTVFGGRGGLEIPVILLPADPVAQRASRRVMGLVPRNPEGPRVVWVFFSSVRWTLGHNPKAPLVSLRQRDEVGLGLARVVAHEVVHAVAPEEPHASGGLMHHSMDRTFLLGAHAPVDANCARAFHRSLGDLLAPPAAAASRASEEGRAPGR